MISEADRIRRLLACEKIQETETTAFSDMLEKLTSKRFKVLTDKQAAWLLSLEDKYELNLGDAPGVLFESGQIPRGKDVPSPAVLQKLPLRPPGRR